MNNSICPKTLSIVVPVYNVEKYIHDCLNSFIVEDILKDIEVIIIDDGSPDKSKEIAQNFVDAFPETFEMISKENGGHGSAINVGISKAKGRFFKVVDGDDAVDPVGLKQLVEFLKCTNSDIVVTNYSQLLSETQNKEAVPLFLPSGVIYQQEYTFDSICNALYLKMHAITIKTSILQENRIHIDEHCFYVDMEYITYPIPYVKTIAFLNAFVYIYRIGLEEQSINIYNMQKRIKDHLKVVMALISFYEKYSEFKEDITSEKHTYIRNLVNRAIASQYKIFLSFKPNHFRKKELERFDIFIQKKSPTLYRYQTNIAIRILRLSHFSLYFPISCLVRYKYLGDIH